MHLSILSLTYPFLCWVLLRELLLVLEQFHFFLWSKKQQDTVTQYSGTQDTKEACQVSFIAMIATLCMHTPKQRNDFTFNYL